MSIRLNRFFWLTCIVFTSGCASVTGTSVGSSSGGWTWPWATGSTYRYLGAAQYSGKRLLDIEGEFDQIAIAPSGRQVVFRGRESRDDYELFISDIDGTVRLLAKTGLEPQSIHWSKDEATLLFLTQETTREGMRPDAPPDVPALPKGKSIQLMTVADGSSRKVLELPGLGAFFPSPMNDRVAVYGFTGYGRSKINGPFDLIDVATGQRQPLRGDLREVYQTNQAVWSPDGSKLVVIDTMTEGNAQRLVQYQAPSWEGVELAHGLQWPGALTWNKEGTALSSIQLDEQSLSLASIEAQGEIVVRARIPLEGPPAGYHFSYYPTLQSPDGRRVLVTRQATSTAPQVLAVGDGDQPQPVNLLFDPEAKTAQQIAPELAPIGWLNDRQVLCYSGRDQAKRLRVVDL